MRPSVPGVGSCVLYFLLGFTATGRGSNKRTPSQTIHMLGRPMTPFDINDDATLDISRCFWTNCSCYDGGEMQPGWLSLSAHDWAGASVPSSKKSCQHPCTIQGPTCCGLVLGKTQSGLGGWAGRLRLAQQGPCDELMLERGQLAEIDDPVDR